MDIKIRGTLLNDSYARAMRYYGYTGITCPSDIEEAIGKANGEDITLYINSDGGSLVVGSEIYSMLKAYKGKTTAYIQSRSASAASVAMMACKNIIADSTALICVHNPSTIAEGDEYVFMDTAEELHNVKESIMAAYEPRMKISRDEMVALMNKNMWINASQAKEYGLIDSISEGIKPQIVNSVGTLMFPTDKMIADYQAHIEAEKTAETENTAKRARALLDLYR